MSVLTSVGILLLSVLVVGFLQLVPGIFGLFFYNIKGKYKEKSARNLAIYYMFGTMMATMFMFLSICAILYAAPTITRASTSEMFGWMMFGIFIALCLVVLGLYYRKGRGSKMFIPRSFATNLQNRAAAIKTCSDAFFMGLFSVVPELIFTLPLYIISVIAMTNLEGTGWSYFGLMVAFMIASLIPLIVAYTIVKRRNMATYMRFRFHNKNFFRFTIALYYLLIASLLVLEMTT